MFAGETHSSPGSGEERGAIMSANLYSRRGSAWQSLVPNHDGAHSIGGGVGAAIQLISMLSRSLQSVLTVVALVPIIVLFPSPALATGQTLAIQWRVENPFRLFRDPADTEDFSRVLRGLSPQDQQRPVLAAEQLMAEDSMRGWAEQIYRKTCWSSSQLRYTCDAKSAYADPGTHRVLVSLSGLSHGLCTWSLQTEDAGAAASTAIVSKPCSDTTVLEIPYPNGADVVVSESGRERARTRIKVRDLFIVGMGDSYASGDGNPDRPVRFDDRKSISYGADAGGKLTGYPARAGDWRAINSLRFAENDAGWLNTPCRRSLYGHQLRAALQLAIEDPHRAVTFAAFACWGAQVVQGIFLPQSSSKLQPGLSPRSQLSDVAALQCGTHVPEARHWPSTFDRGGTIPALKDLTVLACPRRFARPIDLLLLSVGGNDVGFSQLVADAILGSQVPFRNLSGLVGITIEANEAQAQLSILREKFSSLNRALRLLLHIPWSQSERIILTGYPPISLMDESADTCPSGRQGMTVIPGFSLNAKKARSAERVAESLHQTMAKAAGEMGWTFVDAFRPEFSHRGYCAGTFGALASPYDDTQLPRLVDAVWRPYAPSQWRPYAPRVRWIRSPNDGYLTTNFHVPEINFAPMNLLLASSYSGSFHPTAEGQAAMADAVVKEARMLLR
jgi:hypothetical protein